MAILNNSNAISTAGGYDINNSLRFRGTSVSSYLNRTLTTPTLGTKWTWSGWIKRGALFATKPDQVLLATQGTGAQGSIFFNSADFISLAFGGAIRRNAVAVLRDPSAWYHVVVSIDTTQASEPNRAILYINGVQQTWTTSSAITQNGTTQINQAVVHNIGANSGAGAPSYFDGYMAETYFIDGQALTPSSFGETDTTTGSWKPKAYTGTYGTNGFYLKFSDIATTSGSNAGLGKDFSGNTNYWTTNNISVTAGTTYDAMIDSPTLTSATVANYCVNNPVDTSPAGGTNAITISGANLNLAGASTDWAACRATIGVTSGKWYWECTRTGASNLIFGIGLNSTTLVNAYSSTSYGYFSTGDKYSNNVSSAYGASFTSGDVIGVAFDADAGTLTFYKNNTSQGTAYTGLTSGPYFPLNQVYTTGSTASINFGQRPFSYTPPTGFVALNTFNLPDSTIKKGNSYMNAVLYTGNGSTNAITGVGFSPDFVWVKNRAAGEHHCLYDSVRGIYKQLYSNLTNAEDNATNSLLSFDSDGFTLGNNTTPNANGNAHVAWNWRGSDSTAVSNTSGSITSTVSVNTTAGFSVVTYTGTGSAATIGHGLGVAPRMIITKGRNATIEWLVYHASLGATQYITLNTTGAAASAASAWNNTAPTSSVFSVLSAGSTNFSGTNYVAYCWAAIPGYSAFGSWTGNGSTDGPFVYLGFRPKYLLTKPSSTTGSWTCYDTSRDTYNVADRRIEVNDAVAEYNNGNGLIDFLSNGFKPRVNHPSNNSSGVTYIYMAFAENPFKNTNAR